MPQSRSSWWPPTRHSSASISRLLLVRADKVGDLMQVTPLLNALAHQEASVAVDVLARMPALAVLENNPSVRRVLDAGWDETRLAREIEARAYDAVVHLFPERRLIRLCRSIPRSVRKGWINWPGRHQLIPLHRSRSEKSEALYNADLLHPYFPELKVDARPRIYPSPQIRSWAAHFMPRPRLLLNPGSGHAAGAWPSARFAEVGRALQHQLGRALVLWGPSAGEEELARQVAVDAQADLAPATSLMQLAALSERASVMVTNDTGPMHIGAAAGVPLVVIWDGSRVIRPRRWGHHFRDDIVNLDPFDGSSDGGEQRQRRLARISVVEVAQAALRVART